MNRREINERLIFGRVSSEARNLIELLEIGDPGLPMLSPLAKAAWRLLSGRSLSAEDAEAALMATVLIAGDDDESLLSGESICTFEQEKVAHTIPIKISSKYSTQVLDLLLESKGSLQCMLGSEAPLTPLLSFNDLANEWVSSTKECKSPTVQALFNAYERHATHRAPACYPCDSEFIGILEYTLVGIGGECVSGPSLLDQKHDIEWLDHGLLERSPNGREFCWLHQLTSDQAHSLGLRRSSGSHHDPQMPKWLTDDVSFSKLWIGPGDLHKSYTKGTVTGYEVDGLLLCLGAGPEWIPGDLDFQIDDVDSEADQMDLYPETQLPIKIFTLRKGSSCDDPDFNQALLLLERLVKAKNSFN